MNVLIVYNKPSLAPDHPDFESEAGVLESVAEFRAALEGQDSVACLPMGNDARELLDALVLPGSAPDVVVNLCEGFRGRPSGEPHVASLLELSGVPYTGSPPECLSLVRQKVRTKLLLMGAGLPTAPFVTCERPSALDHRAVESLLKSGPVMVKPASEDASLGIGPRSVAETLDAVIARVERLAGQYGEVLIEQFIAGREFNVALVGSPAETALPIAEIAFEHDESNRWNIVTYDAKWAYDSSQARRTPARCPATVSDELADRLRTAAIAASRITGCRDYARVDLRVDDKERIHILEVNGNPDIGPSAGLHKQILAAGWDYHEFLRRTVVSAFERRASAPTSSRASVRPQSHDALRFRELRPDDVEPIVGILRAVGNFRDDEVDVGRELMEETLHGADHGHYQHIVATIDEDIVGWACHGLVPMTDATHDLYWIATDPARQGRGIGRRMLERVEDQARSAGGRWLLAETSASDHYDRTRAFYEGNGYAVLSRIPDFYRVGDGRFIFGKRLDRSSSTLDTHADSCFHVRR